jgi:ATP synthase mitochondrial F1 complex assembly factor 1
MITRLSKNIRPRLIVATANQRNFSGFSWPCPRQLRELVKMSAFEKESAETCEEIWNEYHHTKKDTVSTVLSVSQYEALTSKGKGSPIFLFPLPKGEPGQYMNLVSQH